MKILYIISQRRSGSSLIENLLGQHEQIISVGEFRMLKGHCLKQGPGELWDWKCNCGKEVARCEFWSKYYLKGQSAQPAETALHYRISRKEWLQLLFGNAGKIVSKNRENGRKIAAFTLGLYREIGKDFPGKQIVDSSKDALQGFFLSEASDEVIVLYLRRQLRATVSSKYKRAKMKGKKGSLFKLMIGSFLAEIFNRRIAGLIPEDRLLSFTYEEFVQNKAAIYKIILEKTGVAEKPVPDYFQPYHSHGIGGTPTRFEKRPVSYDDSWKRFYAGRPLADLFGSWLEKRSE